MTHRAEQIIDAVAAALRASSTLQANVFEHRAMSIADDQGELPAVSVDAGEDDPLSELGNDNMAFIDSLLSVAVTACVTGDTEEELKTALFDKRRRIHQALMADSTLGLSFCMGTRYAGAGQMQINVNAERMAGSIETRWRVLYRQNITDPGD